MLRSRCESECSIGSNITFEASQMCRWGLLSPCHESDLYVYPLVADVEWTKIVINITPQYTRIQTVGIVWSRRQNTTCPSMYDGEERRTNVSTCVTGPLHNVVIKPRSKCSNSIYTLRMFPSHMHRLGRMCGMSRLFLSFLLACPFLSTSFSLPFCLFFLYPPFPMEVPKGVSFL